MVDIETLKQINFLRDLPDRTLEKIRALARLETFGEETVLLRQDQEQHLVYMLVKGKIFLNSRSDTGKVLTLDEISPGQTFGISSLLGEAVGAFTAICAEECQIITLSADQMIHLFESDFQVGHVIMSRVVELFKARMNNHTQQFLRSLAVHPAISGPISE